MTSGWQTVELGKVMQLEIDAVPVDSQSEFQMAGVYSFARGLFKRESLPNTQTTYKFFHRLHKDMFVISVPKGWEGALARVSENFDGMFLSPVFPTFRANPKELDIRYFEWYCRQSKIWDELRRKSRGIGARRESISADKFLSLEIPLPPLDEQRRVVERVEALAARIAKAQSLRDEASEESEFLHGSFAAKALIDVSNSPKYSIGNICEVRGGIQKSPARLPDANPTPYLTVAHVQRNHIDISSPTRYFEVSPDELPRWKLEIGDLLIIEGNGSADQIGRVALYRGELGICVHQNHIIRARPNKEIVSSEYLNMYMNSPLGQDEVQKRSRTTSGLRTLSVGRIREIEIPIPPLDEQRRIVAYLDSVQARLASLRELQSAAGEELDALLPSVLDRAFRGEL
jgi:type I restriction enzyme S subunit